LILAASLAGPLLLSFDKKVAFYKNWRALDTLAMAGSFILYMGWWGTFYTPDKLGPAMAWLGAFYLVFLILPLSESMWPTRSKSTWELCRATTRSGSSCSEERRKTGPVRDSPRIGVIALALP